MAAGNRGRPRAEQICAYPDRKVKPLGHDKILVLEHSEAVPYVVSFPFPSQRDAFLKTLANRNR